MGAVARKRVSRRVPYEALRERLFASQLPWDDEAERSAIGAVLLAPNGHAKRLVRRAYAGHFFDKGHGWLWEELGLALVKRKLELDSDVQVYDWLCDSKILSRFREQFFGSCGAEIMRCLDSGFWWHGDYYIDVVLKAAKARSRVITAAELLHEALSNAERWRE